MTQEERWLARYNEVKSFIEKNHRNPSKYYPEEKLMVHFLKRGRKLMNAGELKPDQSLVWYGSMNLLSRSREDDSLMRIVSPEIAAELLELAMKVENE